MIFRASLAAWAVMAATFAWSAPALAAKDCRKGKKLCGDKCISAKKPCPADAAAAPAAQAAAPTCRKGKKLCGDKCIPAKKVCAVAAAPATAAASPRAAVEAEPTAALLATPPGQAMIQLARVLQKSNALDVEDKQRDALRQSLRGARPPLPICGSSQSQLVKACEPVIGGTLTLPCTLAVEEIANFCQERTGKAMPRFR